MAININLGEYLLCIGENWYLLFCFCACTIKFSSLILSCSSLSFRFSSILHSLSYSSSFLRFSYSYFFNLSYSNFISLSTSNFITLYSSNFLSLSSYNFCDLSSSSICTISYNFFNLSFSIFLALSPSASSLDASSSNYLTLFS